MSCDMPLRVVCHMATIWGVLMLLIASFLPSFQQEVVSGEYLRMAVCGGGWLLLAILLRVSR